MTSQDSNTFKPKVETLPDGTETNIAEIARMVFSKPAGKPYSIGLQVCHEIEGTAKEKQHALDMMLTHFLLYGIQTKYGCDAILGSLTNEQIQTLREYMWSVGFDPVFKYDGEIIEFEYKPYRFSQ